jgi:hypothetical protein
MPDSLPRGSCLFERTVDQPGPRTHPDAVSRTPSDVTAAVAVPSLAKLSELGGSDDRETLRAPDPFTDVQTQYFFASTHASGYSSHPPLIATRRPSDEPQTLPISIP